MTSVLPSPSPLPAAALTLAPALPARTPAGLVGGTPLLWIGEPFTDPGRGFWAKLEGRNPGGIKDRTALHMVARARERGRLLPGAPIVESTSGTLGLGLALAGVTYGHPVTVVTDPGMEPMMAGLLRAYGAEVHVVRAAHPVGGWQQARRERVEEILAARPDAWCPDQYHNPDNVTAYRTLAHELIAQLGRIDALVVSVGTGGHSAGVASVLREHFPALRVVGVDTTGSTIFGQPAAPRLMRGLGSSIYPRNVGYSLFDEVHWVAASEAVWAARALARSRCATGGWSVGAVALVARHVAATLPAEARVAAVFPDGPQRYVGTVFDDDYCRRHRLLGGVPAPAPDRIAHPGERVVTRWTACETVVDPLAAGAPPAGPEATGPDAGEHGLAGAAR
ncbi:PLP-dependent cysteine synthase family protein [Streptomyces griseocarneus]|uniref:PLP-dependent cysteine synthase family protein n=1 Tax=Streptomyces griseocarneus TaxID=51201 RepID=UPI00167DF405|nr:PLP-dependent cysteine synthase family protein [Streptomyces griseocarneus]MBZ6474153.1 PLP-dependent cysteine synthase family protein [Streptomyces griseocarneus]GHG52343.1 putative cysteine synthase A CysK2 [Streptomyces griseocarneus]